MRLPGSPVTQETATDSVQVGGSEYGVGWEWGPRSTPSYLSSSATNRKGPRRAFVGGLVPRASVSGVRGRSTYRHSVRPTRLPPPTRPDGKREGYGKRVTGR